MPLYEYKCQQCKKISTILTGVSQDKAKLQCQYCNSRQLEKILSTFGVNIKNDSCPSNCRQKRYSKKKCSPNSCACRQIKGK